MSESNTERLERIGNLTIHRDARKHNFRTVDEADFMWLIEQAEQAQELIQTTKDIIRTANVIDERNQEMRKALTHIADHLHLGEGYEYADQVANSLINRAREGLGKEWWLYEQS